MYQEFRTLAATADREKVERRRRRRRKRRRRR